MVARYFELRMLQKKNQYKQKLTVFSYKSFEIVISSRKKLEFPSPYN